MQKMMGPFVGLGIVMVIGFVLLIVEKGNGPMQLLGIVLMFGAVFAGIGADMKLRANE